MGRMLQKKKNRSSVPKVRQKQKSKKKVILNPIIAANWNQDETFAQNYRRLGLVSKLNKRTGGIDKAPSSRTDADASATDALIVNAPSAGRKNKTVDAQEIQVKRDPKTGAITSVIESSGRSNPLNDPLNDLDASSDDDENGEEEEWSPHESFHLPDAGVTREKSTAVVRELESLAQNAGKKAERTQSEREEEWIASLVTKYGDDYRKMSRDMRLNPMQQTEGDLKRRVKKWRNRQRRQEEGKRREEFFAADA